MVASDGHSGKPRIWWTHCACGCNFQYYPVASNLLWIIHVAGVPASVHDRLPMNPQDRIKYVGHTATCTCGDDYQPHEDSPWLARKGKLATVIEDEGEDSLKIRFDDEFQEVHVIARHCVPLDKP